MEINLIKPYGFCSGVTSAIEIAKQTKLLNKESNVFIFGMLVHNENVINELNDYGICTINSLSDVKKGDIVIIRAHGISKDTYDFLKHKQVKIIDATCPFIAKINRKISNYKGEIIYIGDKNHPETVASTSYSDKVTLFDISNTKRFDFSKFINKKPLILNQSTISDEKIMPIYDSIKKNINRPKFLNCLCPFVKCRQILLNKSFEENYDLYIVVGDKKSNNSKELVNIIKKNKKKYIFIDSKSELNTIDFNKYKKICIISGTSTPNFIVDEIIEYLENDFNIIIFSEILASGRQLKKKIKL